LREAVAVSNKWWLQPTVVANINADIAAAIASDYPSGGAPSLAAATAYENDMNQSGSAVAMDLAAGPTANGAYVRYAMNFTQLKATYTISATSGGPLNVDGWLNMNIVGRGTANTTIVGDGNTNAFQQDNGVATGANSLYLQDMTFRDFVNNDLGSVISGYGNATTTLDNVNFTTNATSEDGTVFFEGTLNVTGGTFVNNIARNGAALYTDYPSSVLTVTGTEFSGNSADSGYGGAISVRNTNFTIANSSFDHNFAGNYTDGSAIIVRDSNGTVTNTTLFQNVSTEYGALAAYNSTVALLNDTIVGNSGITGSAGILAANGSSVTMGSSLLLDNMTAGAQANCSTFANVGNFTSLGGNIVSKGMAGGCRFGAHDKFVTSYKLGKYGFHGGMAQTLPLVAKSVGTGFAPRSTCTTADARGVSRGTTGTCDAGAYQVTKKK
jgi:hypothetical protein